MYAWYLCLPILLLPVLSLGTNSAAWVMWSTWSTLALATNGDTVAGIHAVVAALGGTHMWLTHHVVPELLWWSLAYFVWDLQYLLLFESSLIMLVHAVMGLCGMLLSQVPFMSWHIACLLIFEWSTPCYHLSRHYPSLRLGFACIFWGVRWGWGGYFLINEILPELSFQSCVSPFWTWCATTLLVLSYTMNTYWGILLLLRLLAGIVRTTHSLSRYYPSHVIRG